MRFFGKSEDAIPASDGFDELTDSKQGENANFPQLFVGCRVELMDQLATLPVQFQIIRYPADLLDPLLQVRGDILIGLAIDWMMGFVLIIKRSRSGRVPIG